MSCLLRDHFDSYELLGFGDQVPEGYELANRRHDARSFLSQFWGDYFAMSSLRSFLGQQRSCDLSRMDDAEVVRQVAYCLESGQAKLAVRKRERETYLWVPPPLKIPVPAPPAEIAPYHDVYAVDLTHLYHDDDPVQEAEYELELEDGEKVKGRLSKKGKASIKNLASPPKRVRYGEDQREFQLVDQRKNAHYRPPPKALEAIEPTKSIKFYRPNKYIALHEDQPGWVQEYDFTEGDTVEAKAVEVIELSVNEKPAVPEYDFVEADQVEGGPWFRVYDDEEKGIVADAGNWLWGTLQGSFNESASTSQIVVDAVISIWPLVGDVTALRDLIAVAMRLEENPEKRKEILQWVQLSLLLFALVPVIGGAVKGAGGVLLKMSKGAGKSAEASKLLIEALEVVNRLSIGKAKTILLTLDVEKHLATILGGFRHFIQTVLNFLKRVVELGGTVLPAKVIIRTKEMQIFLVKFAEEGERMIPQAMKELGRRFKVIQECVYEGEYHAIRAAAAGRMASKLTRVAEARLVNAVAEDGSVVQKWVGTNLPHPPNPEKAFIEVEGFPDLASETHLAVGSISTFSGTMRPVHLAEGTKIYRIVGPKNAAEGLWWSYQLPKGGKEWREGWAVIERWNKDGEYVEMIVPRGGLWAWEGTAASQFDQKAATAAFGQFLPGGQTQVLVDMEFPANAMGKAAVSERMATDWGKTTSNVGVPDRIGLGEVRPLGEFEIAPKIEERAAQAAGPAKNATELIFRDSRREETQP